MARQVLPIVGAVVGAYFGNPQLGYAIGSIIGNAVDPQVIKGPKLGEAGIQTSAEGVYRPIVYGTGPVKGNIIERGNRQIKVKREKQGKGGPVTETERAYWTFAIRIAEGPIAGVSRIWMDEKLVYDITPTTQTQADTQEFGEKFRLYLGDETQLPDPDLEAYKGIGNANAYRGTAYIVFPNYDLTDYAERIPDFRFEVVADALASSIAPTIAVGSVDIGQNITDRSPDGITWGDENASPRSGWIAPLADRHWMWWGNAYYTVDQGINWVGPIGDFGITGGQKQATCYGDTLLIPGGSDNGVFRVRSGEDSFTQIIGAYLNNIGCRPGIAVGARSSYGFTYQSFDDGQTWVGAGDHLLMSTKDIYIATGPNGFMACGQEHNGISENPAVSFTETGDFWQKAVLETAPGAFATRATHGTPGGASRWVVGLSNGHIYFSDNDGTSFTQAADSIPNSVARGVEALTWNGSVYIIAGGDDHQMFYSYDGDNWNESVHPFERGVYLLSARIGTGSITPGPDLLSSIVADLHSRVGQTPAQFNVSELTDEVDGLVLAGDYTAADAIRTLMPVYMYDATEADVGAGYTINYIKRGKPVQLTLTYDDLVQAPEETKREDALERPRVLHMHFENPLIGYAPAKASPKRNSPDLKVVGEISTSIPVVFSDVDEAWRTADKMLKVAWAEVGGEQSLSVPMSLLRLIPTDTIGLSLRDQVRRLRITQSEFAGGIAPLTLIADRQSAYTSNLTGVPLPEPTPPPSSIVGPTAFEFLDIPALTDTNDRLLYYVAASGQTPAWYGAVVQRSLDGGANFEDATTFRQNTIMGVLVDNVSAASEFYTDTTNVVAVQLYTEEELDSLTDQQFLSEGGSFAIELAGGGWEILQYRDVVQTSSGTYELSHLARGRLNTGGHEHLIGASVVFLDGVRSVDAITAWIDEDLTHRAVTLGRSPETAAQVTDTYTAQSQTEFPVAHLFGELDSGDLSLTAIPRHRFGTEDHPVQSINHDGYRWSVTDGVTTLTADTAAPAHVFDVSGLSAPITASVAQLNRYTGPGPIVSEDFT